jgi:4'-phosphopantetheinyl transferase
MTALDKSLQVSPVRLELNQKEVHLWWAWLKRPDAQVQRLIATLSADELIRADRFRFERDRQRFIVRRGLLRTILGCYLGIAPDRVLIAYGYYGKPTLADNHSRSTLCFNLSHSNGLALYAVTSKREIGVDIEWIRAIPEAEQIAEQFYSVSESAAFRALSAEKKQEAFFNCWTRKEAYIKARGEGLSIPLSQFEVSLIPGEPASLLNVEQHPEEVSRWSLHALSPAPGYIAALAIEGKRVLITCKQWPE